MAQLHFSDAESAGSDRRGFRQSHIASRPRVVTPVSIGDIVPEGSIFMDFHFEEANPNWLAGDFPGPGQQNTGLQGLRGKIGKVFGSGVKEIVIDEGNTGIE